MDRVVPSPSRTYCHRDAGYKSALASDRAGHGVCSSGGSVKLNERTFMTTHVRLIQLWSVLVDSALAQRVLTYALLGQLTGVPRQVIGCLKPIHDYCNFHNLPPLTALVVCEIDDPL